MENNPISVSAELQNIADLPSVTNFTGKITYEIATAFRRRRNALGASFQQLGQILQIHWSTLRKWENRETVTCHGRHILRLRNFLKGMYDVKIRMITRHPDEMVAMWNKMSPQMHECLEQASKIYGLCSTRPEIGERLIDNMNSAISKTIQMILDCESKKIGRHNNT